MELWKWPHFTRCHWKVCAFQFPSDGGVHGEGVGGRCEAEVRELPDLLLGARGAGGSHAGSLVAGPLHTKLTVVTSLGGEGTVTAHTLLLFNTCRLMTHLLWVGTIPPSSRAWWFFVL